MTTNKDNSGITGSKEVTLESKDFIERSEYDKDISHLQKDLSDTITQVDSDLIKIQDIDHIRDELRDSKRLFSSDIQKIKDQLRKTDIESAGWKHDINQAIEDNNDKKSNVIRGFMGLSVTILGMLFAALWFTIQDQDQKAIMQMMIAINKSDAEQTLKVGQLRLEMGRAEATYRTHVDAIENDVNRNSKFVARFNNRLFNESPGYWRDMYGKLDAPIAVGDVEGK
jgi:hypothetical protein